MDPAFCIQSLEELRSIIPTPTDAVTEKIDHSLDPEAIRFIAAAPLLFVATTDAGFNLDVSPKGDAPGFVKVVDPHALLIPERSGNRLTFGFQNLLQTAAIGLIFVIPGVRETLRVNGRAELTRDPAVLEALAADGKPALLATHVRVHESFFHCGKAFIRSKAWQGTSSKAAEAESAAINQWSRVFKVSRKEMKESIEIDYKTEL